jgi:hypothetical protein
MRPCWESAETTRIYSAGRPPAQATACMRLPCKRGAACRAARRVGASPTCIFSTTVAGERPAAGRGCHRSSIILCCVRAHLAPHAPLLPPSCLLVTCRVCIVDKHVTNASPQSSLPRRLSMQPCLLALQGFANLRRRQHARPAELIRAVQERTRSTRGGYTSRCLCR